MCTEITKEALDRVCELRLITNDIHSTLNQTIKIPQPELPILLDSNHSLLNTSCLYQKLYRTVKEVSNILLRDGRGLVLKIVRARERLGLQISALD